MAHSGPINEGDFALIKTETMVRRMGDLSHFSLTASGACSRIGALAGWPLAPFLSAETHA